MGLALTRWCLGVKHLDPSSAVPLRTRIALLFIAIKTTIAIIIAMKDKH